MVRAAIPQRHSGPVEPEDPSAQGAERLGDLTTDPEGVAVSRTSQSRTARIQAKWWGQSANNRSAKYYELTRTGQEQPEDESTSRLKLSAAAESTLGRA